MELPKPPLHQLQDLEVLLRQRAITLRKAPDEVEDATTPEAKAAAWRAYTIKMWHRLKKEGAV